MVNEDSINTLYKELGEIRSAVFRHASEEFRDKWLVGAVMDPFSVRPMVEAYLNDRHHPVAPRGQATGRADGGMYLSWARYPAIRYLS